MLRGTLKLIAAALAAYTVAALALFLMQRQLIFPGQSIRIRDRPVPAIPGLSSLRLATSEGETEAWYLAPIPGSRERSPTIIFGHGNGEVIDDWPRAWNDFRAAGIGVVLVEYPGYGRAEGHPSEASIRAAMISAYDAAIALPGVDPTRIIGYGQSLGGGAVGQLGAQRSLAAMILQSTFTSLRIFAASMWMPSFLVRDPFDTQSVVRSFDRPLLILHGRQDSLIPFHEAEVLAATAPRAELELYDGGHSGWEPHMVTRVKSFLARHDLLPSPERTP